MRPDHYCELAPFEAEFRRGTPALLYHRLGWPPLFTRRRGLTLPLGLFARQLAELRAAGHGAAVITFDDGDLTTLAALEPLRTHGFRAVQFLVADRIGGVNDWDRTGARLMDAGHVREWLSAGHLIGSHTLTHARLTTLPEGRAREEIIASKHRLEDRFGVAVEQFAYPWGEWDARLAEQVAAAGYRNAYTTEPGVNAPEASPFSLRRRAVWCAWRRPREAWLALTSLASGPKFARPSRT